MMVPGGRGTRVELNNATFLDFIRQQDRKTTLTTSVCTGSALLAKAGLLKGRKATSNKNFFSLAVEQDPSVQWQRKARWVEDGKYITSSGVSAGTDMALGVAARLVGKEHAGHLAHDLEYQWNDDPANDPFAIAEPRVNK
jgi:putative intracellular protease/amidase